MATTRLERIREWYQSGETLTEQDEEWRLLMEEAYNLLLGGKSRSEVANHLKEIRELTEHQRYQVIKDAMSLFGALAQTDKKGLRALLTDRMLRLAAIAEEKDNIDLARKTLHMVASINNLQEDEEKEKVKRKVSVFRYSTDPKVLEQIEGVEYE